MSNEHEDLAAVDTLEFDYSEVERRNPIPRRQREPSGMLFALIMSTIAWALIITVIGFTWNWYSHASMVREWEAKQVFMLQDTCTELIQYGLKMTQEGCIKYFEEGE